jgi:LAO/AO transport system kinase
VLTCSAVELTGIEAIWNAVLQHREKLSGSGALTAKRKGQAVAWMWSRIDEGLTERFFRHPDVKKQLPRITREVERGNLAPTTAAEKLLFSLDNTM